MTREPPLSVKKQLMAAGVVELVRLSDAIIELEGGPGTPGGEAALRSFCKAMGDPKYQEGVARHVDRDNTRVVEYVRDLPLDNDTLANFIEIIHGMVEADIDLESWEACNRDFGGLLRWALQAHPRSLEYYRDITCNVRNAEENKRKFWRKYPRQATADIDLQGDRSMQR